MEQANKKSLFILNEISPRIVLDGKDYELVGIVHYMPGYYVGYAKSGLFWYLYDDLHNKRKNVQSTENVLFNYVRNIGSTGKSNKRRLTLYSRKKKLHTYYCINVFMWFYAVKYFIIKRTIHIYFLLNYVRSILSK